MTKQCLDTSVASVDNTALECDCFASWACTYIDEPFSYLGLVEGDTIKVAFEKMLEKLIGIKIATPLAINSTATLTASQLIYGFITSTSAAATAITIPTAASIVSLIGAKRGTSFDFTIDNSAGASTVTVVVNTGITVHTPVGANESDVLTITPSNAIGQFRVIFTSTTTAKIFRLF